MSPLERAARALAERNDSAYWRGYVGYVGDVQAVLEAIRERAQAMGRHDRRGAGGDCNICT